jgi:putative DNA primase/helicase
MNHQLLDEWQQMLAAVSAPEARLKVFREAAHDIGGHIGGDIATPDAVDGLVTMASVYDFFDVGQAGIEKIIGEEFANESGDRETEREIFRRLEEHDRKRERGANGAPRSGSQEGEIELFGADTIAMESIAWLWSNHLARGKLTMLSGPSELGKSTLAVDLVARLTCGSEWPDGDEAPRGSVVILSAEDGLADTVKPRLVAAGADLSRVHLLPFVKLASGGSRTFSLQADLEKLGEKIRAIGDVSLLVIDPVTAYMGTKIDSHQTVDVRAVLEPLQKAAEAFRFAGLLISHPQKAGATNVLNVVTGSAAFVNAPRLTFITITDPDDSSRTLLLAGKNNLGRKAEGLAYRIESAFVGPDNKILTSRIVWDNLPVRITANEALQQEAEKKRGGASRDAEDFIRERLGNGGITVKDFESEAAALGISKRTLERARKRLNVKAKKDGFQGEWRLFIDKEGAGGKDS